MVYVKWVHALSISQTVYVFVYLSISLQFKSFQVILNFYLQTLLNYHSYPFFVNFLSIQQ